MDLSAIITKTIAESPKDEPRRYIGASGIGKKCNRAIWYGFVGAEREDPSAALKTTFEIGKRLEGLLLDYMESAKLNVVRPNACNKHLFFKDKEIPLFQGHADALLVLPGSMVCIVEIKTAKSSSFTQFKAKGLRAWQESYFAQLQSYLGMSGYKRGVLLAINKDTSELHHEWVDYDDIYYHELRCKAAVISACEEPPEKINSNAIYYICNRCEFRKICHV